MNSNQIEINETDLSIKNIVSERPCYPEDEICRINHNLDYSEFFRNFLQPNLACVMAPDFTRDWASRRDWVRSGTSEPNLNFIESLLEEDATVPVSDCSSRVFNSHSCCEMKFSEYREYWETEREDEEDIKYLKDWHFYLETRGRYSAYRTPPYFCSDWLNEWWEGREDREKPSDYRFVYIGPRQSWTPLHSDVFGSYSWSANIVGRKKWIMLPPGEEDKVRDTFGNVVFDVESEESKVLQEKNGQIRRIEFVQETGEIVFVPSGWFHQVHNLEDTISINHNWFNGCNLMLVYEALKAELRKVEAEMNDCRDDKVEWNAICQGLLRASYGMNYIDFLALVTKILQNRLEMIQGKQEAVSIDGRILGVNHCRYDIARAREVLQTLHCDFTSLDMKKQACDCQLFLSRCEDICPSQPE